MAKANYDLPEELIAEVMNTSGVKTKKDAIILALETYLKRKKIEDLLQSYGKMPTKWTQKTLARYRGRSK